MCTVTIFYKGNNDFVLTSNRDEAPNRKAQAPEVYNINDTQVLLPKDEQSGGSWIGVSNKNRVVCLLNGGFDSHERQVEYRMSRGIVVKELLAAKAIEAAVETYDFTNIEPFTIVIADWNTHLKFYQLVWDGLKTHFEKLPLETKIWSSSTLYDEKQRQARRDWFNVFTSEHQLSSKTVLAFHQTAGNGNADYGVIMNRGFVKTTSITQIEKTTDVIQMRFNNLNTSETSVQVFNLSEKSND
ncbi:NRDE family protein [Lacinutrix neustonica]|uniref:NRDE family protein n=1 Tax=Lacinutrix neustonica TaxID=2980107 RepID=A0A9E8SCX6_9FLAO|nr:NRDE family protein [Lacinutrix neustonica]WAC01476.1 NRDE family protein [Lacinutrix neustonica]